MPRRRSWRRRRCWNPTPTRTTPRSTRRGWATRVSERPCSRSRTPPPGGRPGVVAVLPISRGIAVVGETFADAWGGVAQVSAHWDCSTAEQRGTDELLAEHRRLAASGEGAICAHADGDIEGGLASADARLEATYELPYLAHAPLEPNNGVVRKRE